jgi:pyochelin biosynthetic protein PchC
MQLSHYGEKLMILEATSSKQWIRRYHPASEDSPILVCFPHAGGSATYFSPISAALTPAIDVVAIQYPGHQDRRHDACVDDITELARQIRVALDAAGISDSTRPVAFFGHSMGALVAFEVALLMQPDSGPTVLFASGRRAPSCRRAETLHSRGDAALVDEMRSLGGTDSKFLDDPELLSIVLPVLRSDYEAVSRYSQSASAKIAAPIIALTGDSDPYTTKDEATAWRSHTRGGFALHSFQGGHFYLDEQKAGVLEVIAAFLGPPPTALSDPAPGHFSGRKFQRARSSEGRRHEPAATGERTQPRYPWPP